MNCIHSLKLYIEDALEGADLNLQQLRYARVLADCRSFVQAASICAVTQPTLSNGIAQLEKELGHQLFARTTRTVRLTEAGEYLLPDIIDLLTTKAALVARAKLLSHPERRLIRVGVSPIIGVKFVDLVLQPFKVAHPDVEVVFRELNLAEMVRSLEIGQLEVVFGPAEPASDTKAGWESATLHTEPLVFFPSSQTREKYRRAETVTLDQVSGETFVLVPDACGLTRTTRDLFLRSGLKLKEYSGQAMSYGVLQEWAELGIGSAILPRSKVHEGRGAEILVVEGDGTPIQIAYRSVWHDNASTALEVRRLGDFLRQTAPSIAKGLAH